MGETALSAGELFKAGQLDAALAAATAAVKQAPLELGHRVLLAELLLAAGNLERADVILDAAGQLDPSAATVVAEFRQLLRAETARRQLYREGRVPEFLEAPEPSLAASLAALVALRAGDMAAAAAQAAQAEALRPRVAGRMGDLAFDDFRDASDLHPGFIETLTTTGKYYWVRVARIESMLFHPPRRPRDLIWRRCSMSVTGGPDGDVYVPAIYYAAPGTTDEAHQLGRATSWSEAAPVQGQGQRLFLAGEEAYGIMELGEIGFSA